MQARTSVRVSEETRQQLSAIASASGTSIDGVIVKLLRLERQHRMGRELSDAGLSAEDDQWLTATAETVRRAGGR